jgi:hypothetical protein
MLEEITPTTRILFLIAWKNEVLTQLRIVKLLLRQAHERSNNKNTPPHLSLETAVNPT